MKKLRKHMEGMPLTVKRMESGTANAPEEWRPRIVFATLLGQFMGSALVQLSDQKETFK